MGQLDYKNLSEEQLGECHTNQMKMQTPIVIWALINHPVKENLFDLKIYFFFNFNNCYL